MREAVVGEAARQTFRVLVTLLFAALLVGAAIGYGVAWIIDTAPTGAEGGAGHG